MKLCRFQPLVFPAAEAMRAGTEARPDPRCGVIVGAAIEEFAGELFGPRSGLGRAWPLEQVKLLPPVVPSKIICVGRNYLEHAAELKNPVPKEPLIFLKPPSAVIGPEEPILLPPQSSRVDFEGELAVVIGRGCSHLGPSDDVREHILGFTCLNDVTARDIQKAEGSFTRAKGFDTFCPFGPVVETELDPADAALETYVNGARRQAGRTADMIFPIDFLLRWISHVMTLAPGDLIATGTPSGVGPLAAGDVVEVVVSGVGTLRNPVASAEA